MTITQTPPVDSDRLEHFLGRFVNDLGATMAAGSVEPRAGDTVSDNLNPVGRVYYSFSTFLCVPNAVSQGGRLTLGAQAGEQAIREVVTEAGFTRFRGPRRRRSTSSTRSVPNPQPDRRTA